MQHELLYNFIINLHIILNDKNGLLYKHNNVYCIYYDETDIV